MMIYRLLIMSVCLLLSYSVVADPYKVLKQNNIVLPEVSSPLANYVKTLRVGELVYTSGHVSIGLDGTPIKGKLGKTMTVEQGKEAAKATAVQILTSLQQELGDLHKIKRIVKVVGMVNATSDFTEHSQVMNGFSDFIVEVFGDKGRHVRTAVGMNSLPGDYALEIEVIVQVN
ncbi:RidA family protein [Agaribacter flavus]|uniref:RidA family protein n=1 Tax=Agaribacter flavus TaxID=1902781 RepID=A0ABV7FQJ1_9ALTE